MSLSPMPLSVVSLSAVPLSATLSPVVSVSLGSVSLVSRKRRPGEGRSMPGATRSPPVRPGRGGRVFEERPVRAPRERRRGTHTRLARPGPASRGLPARRMYIRRNPRTVREPGAEVDAWPRARV